MDFSVGQTYTTINNSITPDPADTGIVIRVDTVVGSGAIATFTIIDGGTGNTIGNEIVTNKGGNDATFTVSGISTAQDGIYSSSFANSQFISFDPTAPDETSFYNTAFNPLINNASSSVKNTYIMKVEYDDGEAIPSNILPIANRTAEKAQVPDSNYTTTRIINPRYVGSRLQSANYNNYTPATSSITFLNALSGSAESQSAWDGDNSYANTAVINKNPIYFAHFKSSFNNNNFAGTYTFEIDQLILSPTSSVQGSKAPPTPVVLKVDGSGKNLTEVRSTFEVDRKVAVAYDSIKFNKIDYGKLKTGDNVIFQGALEFSTIGASTTGETGQQNQFRYPNFAPTMSFITSSWCLTNTGATANGKLIAATATFTTLGGANSFLLTGSNQLILSGDTVL